MLHKNITICALWLCVRDQDITHGELYINSNFESIKISINIRKLKYDPKKYYKEHNHRKNAF